ncbi:MAG: TetR/AcrR family transcriptional regulator [Acidimicrobiia bacterium]|jgi:AcrR family transcriptional regulator
MLGTPNAARNHAERSERPAPPTATDRQGRRREETRREILAAAWAMAGEHGLGGISLRELGARVGMKAQSLYSYFPSKQAILDAMFAQGAAEFYAATTAPTVAGPDDPRARCKEQARRMFGFSAESTPRYQLLFQRPIPGFEPSPEAFGPAVAAYESMREQMGAIGVESQQAIDLWTALLDGLTDQQVTNDPGGERWAGLVDHAVDMWFDYVTKTASAP